MSYVVLQCVCCLQISIKRLVLIEKVTEGGGEANTVGTENISNHVRCCCCVLFVTSTGLINVHGSSMAHTVVI